MPENHSRAGKRVEMVSVNDEPHEHYRWHDPWTGEELSHGMPILKTTAGGKIVEKEINHQVVQCPECDVDARYNDNSEPLCPICGIICSGKGVTTRDLVVDAKAAGRLKGSAPQNS